MISEISKLKNYILRRYLKKNEWDIPVFAAINRFF